MKMHTPHTSTPFSAVDNHQWVGPIPVKVVPGKSPSPIWKAWRVISSAPNRRVIECLLCPKDDPKQYNVTGGSTSRALHHFKHIHPNEFYTLVESQQQDVSPSAKKKIKIAQCDDNDDDNDNDNDGDDDDLYEEVKTRSKSRVSQENILPTIIRVNKRRDADEPTRGQAPPGDILLSKAPSKKFTAPSSIEKPPSPYRKRILNYISTGGRILNHIITELQPVSEVEDLTFRDLFLYLNPKVTIPTKSQLVEDIRALAVHGQFIIKQRFLSLPSKLSIALLIFPAHEPYPPLLGIRAYWVDQNWALRTLVLDIVELESDSNMDICDALTTCLEEYEISDKIIGFTTDNTSSDLSQILTDQCLEQASWHQNHALCTISVLHMTVHSFLSTLQSETCTDVQCTSPYVDNDSSDNEMEENEEIGLVRLETLDPQNVGLLLQLRTCIARIRAVPECHEAFLQSCKSSKMKPHIPIVVDVADSWTATLEMMQYAIEYRQALDACMDASSLTVSLKLCDLDWLKIIESMKLLKTFEAVSSFILSPANNPILPAAVAVYTNLIQTTDLHEQTYIHKFNTFGVDQQPCWYSMARACRVAKHVLNQLYSKSISDVHSIAMVLDPTFRLFYAKQKQWDRSWIDNMRKTMHELFNTTYVPAQDIDAPSDKRIDPQHEFHTLVLTKIHSLTENKELKQFLNMPPVSYAILKKGEKKTPGFYYDALDWWRAHEIMFPNLSKMAKDYLSIPCIATDAQKDFMYISDRLMYVRNQISSDPTFASNIKLRSWIMEDVVDPIAFWKCQ